MEKTNPMLKSLTIDQEKLWSYYIRKADAFVFDNGVEIILTLVSSLSCPVLIAYVSINDENWYSCRVGGSNSPHNESVSNAVEHKISNSIRAISFAIAGNLIN